jgi:hypothetical protein
LKRKTQQQFNYTLCHVVTSSVPQVWFFRMMTTLNRRW